MKFEIEHIDNGYLLTLKRNDPDSVEKYAFHDFIEILHLLQDEYDPGSRHDEKRIYIIKAPGDKHPDFKDYHAKTIWGKD